jgi:ubiquinone/menaquinone biosynthesis C-methylase UbiE
MNPTHDRHYVPAAGHDWALPLYDPFLRLFRLDALRDLMLTGVDLRAGQRVLDVGCGTGTLVTRLKRQAPGLHVTGVDPDAKALASARKKSGLCYAEATWHRSSARNDLRLARAW